MLHRIDLMGCPLDVGTMNDTVELIESRIQQRQFTQHVVVNVAKLVNMRSDSFLDNSVRSSDIINIDGMGILFGARFLGNSIPERVAGVDLFHALLKMSAAKNHSVFLLGGTAEIVEETKARVEAMYPSLKVVGAEHGYFWDDEEKVVNEISASGARLLFVAITSPKKENFINKWQDRLGVDFVMGVGGTFDVVAGKVKRAPLWMQNSGLEWLYRLLQEPRRMWKRYVSTNSRFALLLLRAKLGFSTDYHHEKPTQD